MPTQLPERWSLQKRMPFPAPSGPNSTLCIRTEDSSQLPFGVFLVHGITSQTQKPPKGCKSPLEVSPSEPSGGAFQCLTPEG